MTPVTRSLRLKVSLGVSLALILLLAPFNWLQYQYQRRGAIADLSELASTTGAVAERSLEEAMLSNNRAAIQAIVDSVAQATDVQAVYLLATDAVVAASPGALQNGVQLDRSAPLCQGCHRFPAESRPSSIAVAAPDGQPLFRTMTLIPNRPACQACHSPQDRLNGVFYMDFSMAGVGVRLDRSLRTAFLASIAIIVLSAVVIYVLMSGLVITRMERVAQALRHFSRGQRTARVIDRSHDEVGLLADVFNEMADTIQAQEAHTDQLYTELKARDDVRRQLLARLTTASEEERRYVAREIHDELGQLLTGLSLNLKLCQQSMREDPDMAHEYLAKANALVRETIDEAHRLIEDLRPAVLDDYGLIPALQEELRKRLEPLGIGIRLETAGEMEAFPAEMTTAAFRIVQEAVTNVIRHANARQVNVRVERAADGLTVTVEDDGTGLPGKDRLDLGGLGILGMQERADALGGHLEVSCRHPNGTRVALWLPEDRSEL